MNKLFVIIGVGAAVFLGLTLGGASSADAQGNDVTPRLPAAPLPQPGVTPGPFGGIAAENYLVTSAANEHGSYLWVVAPVQHVVILCEKLEQTKDFSCTTKRLP
jgi:hypothetical protein